MTTQEVANRFYELMELGQFEIIYSELYASHAKSIEPTNSGFISVEGLEAILEKGKQFHEKIEEMHGGYTNSPIVAGNYFACAMGMDVTMKGQPRLQLDEIAVYEVKDGKIVSEQFFF